ncbi:MAG: OmpA family protein [Burkholderiales bacterium]|nr:OmpA family protein [Burkholderiales bacterium]
MKAIAHRSASSLLLALVFGGAASAGDVVFYRQGERPDPATIARVLQGPAAVAQAPKVRMRGLKLSSDEAQETRIVADAGAAAGNAVQTAAVAPVATAAPVEAEPSSVALQVQFGYNSAEILPEMIASLDAVAEGIKMTGGVQRIVIEGHTDAYGAADYNIQLSRRRAAAVKQFLVARHGIPAESLVVMGRGKSAPLIPANPFAPENRRVEFHAAE